MIMEIRSSIRFSLRTCFVIVTVAGLGLGLFGRSLHKAQQEHRAVKELVRLGSSYDDWIGWREVFGPQYRPILHVSLPPNVSLDEAIEHLVHLDKLKSLSLNVNTGDVELANLKQLYWINSLELSATRISDQQLRHLEPLTGLKWLDLGQTRVSDEAITRLQKRLPGCRIER